jgi:hypothetical protein
MIQAMASNRILWFMCTCIPIWARGSLSLDSHNNSDIVDAGNLMYPSHGGTQAGRVQSNPAGDPFACGQCSTTTGQLSIRIGLRMFQVLPVTVTSNQAVVRHHMPACPSPGVPVLVEALASNIHSLRDQCVTCQRRGRRGARAGRLTPASVKLNGYIPC